MEALVKEMELQKDYLEGEEIETIYFGGGTPSLLSQQEVEKLLRALNKTFPIAEAPEITLEANPDDLDRQKLRELYAAGINRLSIGIQSFHDTHLQSLNRAHSATEAKNSVLLAREAGFSNISIDLIYAIPSPDDTLWLTDLEEALLLQPEHISSYCLTIEPKTAFGNWLKKGKLKPIDEEYAARQFEILLQKLQEAGYEQYEISNFCLPGSQSRHNSSYWQQKKYLGLGPSAHSYNRISRQYNVGNNARYLKALANNQLPFEREELQRANMINEYIMTGLRTSQGCKLTYLRQQYQFDLKAANEGLLSSLLQQNYAFFKEDALVLTDTGKLLADEIASKLMTEE